MTLVEKINCIGEQSICKLLYNGEVVALRVKLFNPNTDKFEYSDFLLKVVSDNVAIRDFINSLQSQMPVEELISNNGKLVTKAELENNYMVDELVDYSRAVDVLSRFRDVHLQLLRMQ